ncbi:MAG: LuxR C-terminal-related transcriptional regulator [Pseudomonadota bacterium]
MDFLESLAEAQTPSAANEAFAEQARALDALHVSHRCGADAERVHIRTSLPDDWIAHYREEEFDKVDPGPRHAAVSRIANAFHFDLERPALPPGVPFSERSALMFKELRATGVNGTFFVPLPGLPGRPVAMATFFHSGKQASFASWAAERAPLLKMVAAAANVRILDLLATDEEARPRRLLAPREREALQWLAAGHRVDRIGEKMGVSGRTVEFHLKNARAKLDARTREEALARAILSGEVEL